MDGARGIVLSNRAPAVRWRRRRAQYIEEGGSLTCPVTTRLVRPLRQEMVSSIAELSALSRDRVTATTTGV